MSSLTEAILFFRDDDIVKEMYFSEFEAGAAKKHLRGVAKGPLELVKDKLWPLKESVDDKLSSNIRAIQFNIFEKTDPFENNAFFFMLVS